MSGPEAEANLSGSRGSGQNLNNMVAKVTVETPGGTSTKYYLLYRDPCFSLGSLIVGAIGGLGVGFYSKVFFEQTRRKIKLPFKIRVPEISLAMKLNNRPLNIPLLFGKTVWWRLGSRALLSSVLYCFLECRLQGTWYRRSYMDCGLAGAISGAVFGVRGIPGGAVGAGMGALGFGGFAAMCRFLFL